MVIVSCLPTLTARPAARPKRSRSRVRRSWVRGISGQREVSQAEREGVSATDATAASPLGVGESIVKQGNERMYGRSDEAHTSDQVDVGVGGRTGNRKYRPREPNCNARGSRGLTDRDEENVALGASGATFLFAAHEIRIQGARCPARVRLFLLWLALRLRDRRFTAFERGEPPVQTVTNTVVGPQRRCPS